MKTNEIIRMLGIGILVGTLSAGSAHKAVASSQSEVALATKLTREIAYVSYALLDSNSGGLSGNGNGIADDGETFELTVTLTSRWAEYTDISAELISLNEYATVIGEGAERTGAVSTYPSTSEIRRGFYTKVTNVTPFKVTLANNIPNRSGLPFILEVSGKRVTSNGVGPAETFSVGFELPIMRIGLVNSNSQFGNPGAPAPLPLEVMLTFGNVENWELHENFDSAACQGRRVTFDVIEGDCELSSYQAVTNEYGRAQVQVTSLGTLDSNRQVAKSVIKVTVDGSDALSRRKEHFVLYAHNFDIDFKKVWDMQEALNEELEQYDVLTGPTMHDEIRPYQMGFKDFNNDGEKEIGIVIYITNVHLTTVAIIKYFETDPVTGEVINNYMLIENLDTYALPEIREIYAWTPDLIGLNNAGSIFIYNYPGLINPDDPASMDRISNLTGICHYREIKTANVDDDDATELLALRHLSTNLKGDQLIYVLEMLDNGRLALQQELYVGDLSSGDIAERITDMIIGDLDNDRKDEIVISCGVLHPNRMIYFKYEDGRFVRKEIEVSGADVFPADRGIVADLDNDGKKEFLGLTYNPTDSDGGDLPGNVLFTARLSQDGTRLESNWQFSLNNRYTSDNKLEKRLSGEALRLGTLPNLLGENPVVFADLTSAHFEDGEALFPARVYMFSSIDGELTPIKILEIEDAKSISDVKIGDFNNNGLTDLMVRVSGFGDGAYSGKDRNVMIYEEVPELPAAPSDLTVQLQNGKPELSWEDNSLNESEFKVLRITQTADAGYAAVSVSVRANETTYTDENTTAETTYTYQVCASNTGGDSEYSNEVELTVPIMLELQPIDDIIIKEGETVTRLLADYTTGVKIGEVLNYSFTSNLQINGANLDSYTGVFTWTPNNGDAGEYIIAFTVSGGTDADGGQREDSETLIIEVYPPFHPCDVNRSGRVTPLDVLELIQFLNMYGSGVPASTGGDRTAYFDVTTNSGRPEDGVTPLDILTVISVINHQSQYGSSGEGEGSLQLSDNVVLDESIKSLKAVNSNIAEFYADREKAFYIDYDNDDLISKGDYNAYIAEITPELSVRQKMMLKYEYVLVPSELLYGENVLKMENVRLSDGKTCGYQYFIMDHDANRWVRLEKISLHCGNKVLKTKRTGTSISDYFVKDSGENQWVKLKPYRWTRRWLWWTWRGTTSPRSQYSRLRWSWRWWWYRRVFWKRFNIYLNNAKAT